jgi:hypothetical protein
VNASPTRRARGTEPEPPPGNELAALLWIVAALLAAYLVVVWVFARMFAQ